MFNYRKTCLLIKMRGLTLYTAIHYYEDDDFMKKKYSMTKGMLTVNISQKLKMTEICNIHKLY